MRVRSGLVRVRCHGGGSMGQSLRADMLLHDSWSSRRDRAWTEVPRQTNSESDTCRLVPTLGYQSEATCARARELHQAAHPIRSCPCLPSRRREGPDTQQQHAKLCSIAAACYHECLFQPKGWSLHKAEHIQDHKEIDSSWEPGL